MGRTIKTTELTRSNKLSSNLKLMSKTNTINFTKTQEIKNSNLKRSFPKP